jgi:hypothetical protein
LEDEPSQLVWKKVVAKEQWQALADLDGFELSLAFKAQPLGLAFLRFHL